MNKRVTEPTMSVALTCPFPLQATLALGSLHH